MLLPYDVVQVNKTREGLNKEFGLWKEIQDKKDKELLGLVRSTIST